MKIRFLKAEKSRFGDWQPGDEEDVHDPEAERLIGAGIAEPAVIESTEWQPSPKNSTSS